MDRDREQLYDELGRVFMRAAVDALIANENAPQEPASSPGRQSLQLQQQVEQKESDGCDHCTDGETAATPSTCRLVDDAAGRHP